MNNYYFTYGGCDEHQPFNGGWTVVRAETMNDAIELFNTVHKPRREYTVNCAWFYEEELFVKTGMAEHGNFGKGCQEIIGAFTPDELSAASEMINLKILNIKEQDDENRKIT